MRARSGSGVVRRPRLSSAGAFALIVLAALLAGTAVYLRIRRASPVEQPVATADAAVIDGGAVAPAPPPDGAVSGPVATPDAAPVSVDAAGAPAVDAAIDAAASTEDRAAQAKALLDQANDAIQEGAFDRALSAADSSLALRKTPRAYLARAKALQRLDRIDDALAAIAAAEQMAPKYASVFELRGRILWAARRKDEARMRSSSSSRSSRTGRAPRRSSKLPRRAPLMRVLGLESSCDETAAAIVDDGTIVLSDVVASQHEVHARYGGVVPELASRAHILNVVPVVQAALERAGVALDDIDGIAVTNAPGLVGALLVGLQTAKALAWVTGKPLVGVHHLEGHLSAIYLEPEPPPMPHLALIVSGGHTSLVRVDGHGDVVELGATRDDAAGEAFDKGAKLLGLGYPGGVVIDRLAQDRRSEGGRVPARDDRGVEHGADFSFSGLKTALLHHVRAHGVPDGQALADLCASYQAAIVEVLVRKTRRTARRERLAARPDLRRRRGELGAARGAARGRRRGRLSRLRAAAGALHRQRRDDRGRGLSPARARRARRASISTPCRARRCRGARERRRHATATAQRHGARAAERSAVPRRARAARPLRPAREEVVRPELPDLGPRVPRDRRRDGARRRRLDRRDRRRASAR